jgi:hypothetical protein
MNQPEKKRKPGEIDIPGIKDISKTLMQVNRRMVPEPGSRLVSNSEQIVKT